MEASDHIVVKIPAADAEEAMTWLMENDTPEEQEKYREGFEEAIAQIRDQLHRIQGFPQYKVTFPAYKAEIAMMFKLKWAG